MSVPNSVTDLDPVASNNSPAGSEPIGQNLDEYLRAHAAIIRQVSDASKVETQIHGASGKAAPVDADELPLADSAASFGLKKLTFANLKATLKTYFDTLYLKLSGGTLTGLLKFAAGANIASAATVDLTAATGNTVHITGTTGIGAWTMTAGQFMNVIFDGVLTLTHNATTNNLQGAANITTAAGDRATVYYDGTTTYVFGYQRADGTQVAPLVFSNSYKSAEQTITSGGQLTLAHSLGVEPKEVSCFLKCVTAEQGYSVGDEVPAFTSQITGGTPGTSRGLSIRKNTTSIILRYGAAPNAMQLLSAVDGTLSGITNANWRLIVKAYA